MNLEFETHENLIFSMFLSTERVGTNICWMVCQDGNFKICLSALGRGEKNWPMYTLCNGPNSLVIQSNRFYIFKSIYRWNIPRAKDPVGTNTGKGGGTGVNVWRFKLMCLPIVRCLCPGITTHFSQILDYHPAQHQHLNLQGPSMKSTSNQSSVSKSVDRPNKRQACKGGIRAQLSQGTSWACLIVRFSWGTK